LRCLSITQYHELFGEYSSWCISSQVNPHVCCQCEFFHIFPKVGCFEACIESSAVVNVSWPHRHARYSEGWQASVVIRQRKYVAGRRDVSGEGEFSNVKHGHISLSEAPNTSEYIRFHPFIQHFRRCFDVTLQ
jgi:hypothetical protein